MRELDLAAQDWRADPGLTVERTARGLAVTSTANEARFLHLVDALAPPRGSRVVEFEARGAVQAGSGVAVAPILDGAELHDAPIPSSSSLELGGAARVGFRIRVGAGAQLLLERLAVRFTEASESLADHVGDHRVAIVTPLYPSSANMYLCGFVHSRAREYAAHGIRPLVLCTHQVYRYQTLYELEGLRVLRGDLLQLGRVLDRSRFDKILLHFFDEHYGLTLQRSLRNATSDVVLICHGAETLFREFVTEIRPYFTPLQPVSSDATRFWAARQHAIELFNRLPNVHWVFVSRWQRQLSEKSLGVRFASCEVITNFISPELFPFREKEPELRRKVFFVRRFNDERHYSIDVAVETVLALSERPGFDALEFHFWGDGHAYDALVAPLRGFSNVHLHRTFLEQAKITEAHAGCGVALFPVQFDNTGVSSCEAASSGLAVLTSDVGAHGEFLPAEAGLFARDNDPREYADMIERLAGDPEFFERARRMQSRKVQEVCSWANTIGREVELIRQPPTNRWAAAAAAAQATPAISVFVPLHGDGARLERCVASLLQAAPEGAVQVLIADIGATATALDGARALETALSGRVRLLTCERRLDAALTCAVEHAKGTWFRFVDCEDWVDPLDFARLVERLGADTADLVLTNAAEDRAGAVALAPVRLYDTLTPGRTYGFAALSDPSYGFRSWGPLPATATYRTEALRRAAVALPAQAERVELQFTARALAGVERVRYLDLDVHRRSLPAEAPAQQLTGSRRERGADLAAACAVLAAPEYGDMRRACVLRSLIEPAVLERTAEPVLGDDDRAADRALAEALARLGPIPRKDESAPAIRPPAGAREQVARLARAATRYLLPYAYVQASNGNPTIDARLLKSLAKNLLPYGAWSFARKLKVRAQSRARK